MYDVVVVGGGPAGVTAALRARELGATVGLVERGLLGGTCTLDGVAPTRVLARAARLMRDTEQFRDYGLVGDRPTVDLATLMSRTQQMVYRLQEKKQLLDNLTASGVDVRAGVGDASFVDSHTIALPSGERVEAEKFILCVGGHSREVPLAGGEHALRHADVWHLTEVPKSIVIVGAAATGCQFASIFDAFGCRVTLLEGGPRVLANEDDALSFAMERAFEVRGIDVRTGIGRVDRIEPRDGHVEVFYRNEATGGSATAEQVLLAIGWVGNVESLNLEAAGVRTERGSVWVDDRLRTSQPSIYAAGDITGRMMLVQSASHEGRIAAENAVLGGETSSYHRIVPHGSHSDPEYASVGLTEYQARQAEECAVAFVPYYDLDRAVIDGRTEGFFRLIVSRRTRQILGAHVVGEQAVEIIQVVAVAMAAEMPVEDLAAVELAYPTLAEVIGLAARQVVRELGLTSLAAEWRTLRGRRSAEWESPSA